MVTDVSPSEPLRSTHLPSSAAFGCRAPSCQPQPCPVRHTRDWGLHGGRLCPPDTLHARPPLAATSLSSASAFGVRSFTLHTQGGPRRCSLGRTLRPRRGPLRVHPVAARGRQGLVVAEHCPPVDVRRVFFVRRPSWTLSSFLRLAVVSNAAVNVRCGSLFEFGCFVSFG